MKNNKEKSFGTDISNLFFLVDWLSLKEEILSFNKTIYQILLTILKALVTLVLLRRCTNLRLK
jgi:hypothetical protein